MEDKILNRNLRYLVLVMLAMVFLPYIGGYIYVHGTFPEGYFQFPPITAKQKPSFSPIVFCAGALLMAGFITFYLFPRVFGFRKVDVPFSGISEGGRSVRLPWWFWVGNLLWGVTLFVLWGHFPGPAPIIHWAALFLFWGFSLMVDGIVYKRTGGVSLLTSAPRELIGIGTASISGWLLFEFLNFFVDDNWCYPFGGQMPLSEFVMYAVIASSGLMPMALEWYSFFNVFPKLRYRFSFGPKIVFSKTLKIVLLVLSLTVMFLIPFFPMVMFPALWVAPMVILACMLSLLQRWTPFTGIRDGNWGPLALSALSYGVQGILCECWNYFSGIHNPDGSITTHNPDYWTYSIPYIDKYHVFEMPLLGLMGYLPFGVYCAVWWIAFAYLLNIPTQFFDDGSEPLPTTK